MSKEELVEGAKVGLAYTTVSTKPARYLRWMKDELEQRGVEFVTRHVGSIEEAATYGGDASILINATGLGELRSAQNKFARMNLDLRIKVFTGC